MPQFIHDKGYGQCDVILIDGPVEGRSLDIEAFKASAHVGSLVFISGAHTFECVAAQARAVVVLSARGTLLLGWVRASGDGGAAACCCCGRCCSDAENRATTIRRMTAHNSPSRCRSTTRRARTQRTATLRGCSGASRRWSL